MSRPLRLSVSASPGQKVFAAIFALVFLGILTAVAIVAMAVLFGLPNMDSGGYGLSDFGPARLVVTVVLVAIGVMVVGGFAYALLGTFRGRADLDGAVLTVRGAVGTRRADLSRARVWIDSIPEYARDMHHDRMVATGRRIPRLVAAEPQARPLRLRLRGQGGGFLPPHELLALADAIDSGRQPGQAGQPGQLAHAGQAGQAGQGASEAGDLLRRLATDPLPRLL
ncbi:hypothetical protein J5X84_09495 [Streptosporangiaceae bacterium NEAU-GS5]|nr:hypothetical protein [Streptosporangiaceae bacterium NEAU-GS5]